jgi:hypothetical protein
MLHVNQIISGRPIIKLGTFVCLLLAMSMSAALAADGAAAPQFPPLFSYARPPASLDFCDEPVAFDTADAKERFEKEMLLTLWDRPQVVLWIKRATRYLPVIESMLREAGLPDDLKYMAVAESALRPHAGSRKGAIGFWQFLASTGRKYGLKIDSEKDERRNIFRSTEAAIAYLKELHGLFGSWTLAAAAYNMGENGLQTEILAQRTGDYYQLYLPLETQRYLFRIYCAKLILENPQAYGFTFDPADLYPPIEYDRARVECFQPIPLQLVAEAAGTYFKKIKDLNPELRGHFLAAGIHTLLVPPGSSRGLEARLKKLSDRWVAEKEERVYVVREGDSLTGIATRFGVPLKALVIWNRLENEKYIHPGQRLVIYAPAIETEGSGRQ